MSEPVIYQCGAGAVEAQREGMPLPQSKVRDMHLSGPAGFLACLEGTAGHRMRVNNTRQGYARKRTLKPAGYLFLGARFAPKGRHA